MDYIDETLKFIESKEIREHLRTWRRPLDRDDCGEIVSRAPASLERKIPVLDLIAEQTEYDPERINHDPAIFAKHARLALDGLYNTSPGTVFLIDACCYEDRKHGRELFTTFEAVKKYIHETGVIYSVNPNPHDYLWFYVEKWIPGEDGKMNCPIYYYLNSLGEVWYFDYTSEYEPDDYGDTLGFFDHSGDANLAVPFLPGDIIIADCSPFAEERKVLILENLDSMNMVDCCGVRCLHITQSGKIDECALKHNSFIRYSEHTYVSVLYRATVYNGELTESETPLSIVSNAVKENPELGHKIHEYLINLSLSASEETRSSKKEDKYEGIEWEELKNKFGL